jgi:hypothetical protein
MNRDEAEKWRAVRDRARAVKDRAIQRELSTLTEAERKEFELACKETRQHSVVRQRDGKDAREKRNKRFQELLLRGYTQAEIAKATGAHEGTVSRVLSSIFPFPPPGRDNRYIVARMSPVELGTLDEMAGEYLMDRLRLLELLVSAVLEQHGFQARKLLRLPGSNS